MEDILNERQREARSGTKRTGKRDSRGDIPGIYRTWWHDEWSSEVHVWMPLELVLRRSAEVVAV